MRGRFEREVDLRDEEMRGKERWRLRK